MFRKILSVSVLVMIMSLGACKTAQKSEGPTDISNGAGADDNILGDSDSGKAMGLKTIHFPYDSSNLDSGAKADLKSNADILKDKKSAKVQIEGHCDQRGGIQYNIALGEKRANSVKNYLQDMGVAADRITTISYGKERPVETGITDDAQAKNRRANFVITAK
ncbi:MAG: OmpA family protein [Methylotenera sp.]|nr:OmpA family protein [Oligoflexia bacterium]